MASLNDSSRTLEGTTLQGDEPSTVEADQDSDQNATVNNDADLEDEIMGGTTEVPEENSAPQAAAQAPNTELPPSGPPPSRKDASLREFLGRMDEFAPIVCSNFVTSYAQYLHSCDNSWVYRL